MRLKLESDPARFLETHGDWLLRHEAMNNVFFGVLADACEGRYDLDTTWFAAVFEGGETVGLAIRTPPFPAAIAFPTQAAAMPTLLDSLWSAYEDPRCLMSPELESAANRHRADRGRAPASPVTRERVYELRRVRRPTREVEGKLRLATSRDAAVVQEWGAGFQREALSRLEEGALHRSWEAGRMMIAARELYLWEVDERPVSMAAARGPTPNGIRISYVYTPPALRRRGYASALVAELSQAQLDLGRSRCFLFTDLENPTSNRIYQDVGYQAVGDVTIYGT